MVEFLGYGLLFIGLFFMISGLVGLFRMPDFFTKLHAGGVLESCGAPIFLTGLACLSSSWHDAFKLVLAAVLIIILGPLSTHLLAKAGFVAKSRRDAQE